MNLDN